MPETSLAARRAELARAERQVNRHPDQPEHAGRVLGLRRDYAAAKLVAYVAEVVGQAPQLSPAQCARISALLRGGGSA
jgi:hypothetical protein